MRPYGVAVLAFFFTGPSTSSAVLAPSMTSFASSACSSFAVFFTASLAFFGDDLTSATSSSFTLVFAEGRLPILCGSSSEYSCTFGAGASLLRFLPVLAGCFPSSCASALSVCFSVVFFIGEPGLMTDFWVFGAAARLVSTCFGVCFFEAAFVLDLAFGVTGVAGGLDNCCLLFSSAGVRELILFPADPRVLRLVMADMTSDGIITAVL